MPYREKIAWLSLFAIAVTYGPYFTLMASGTLPVRPLPDLSRLGYFALTTVVQMTLMIVGHIALRLTSPDDARAKADERDSAITRLSVSTAYYVLMAGAIVVGCVLPFLDAGWSIVNGTILTIVLAEVVRYAIVVVRYRGQAA